MLHDNNLALCYLCPWALGLRRACFMSMMHVRALNLTACCISKRCFCRLVSCCLFAVMSFNVPAQGVAQNVQSSMSFNVPSMSFSVPCQLLPVCCHVLQCPSMSLRHRPCLLLISVRLGSALLLQPLLLLLLLLLLLERGACLTLRVKLI